MEKKLVLTPQMIASNANWLREVKSASGKKDKRNAMLRESTDAEVKLLFLAMAMSFFKKKHVSPAALDQIKKSKSKKYLVKYMGSPSKAKKTLDDAEKVRLALDKIGATILPLISPYFAA